MTTRTQFPWNLVARNLRGQELLRKNIRDKISRLEAHLKHLPPDAVHLHIALERQASTESYIATLALRLPSNIVHCEKSADDITRAFDDAVAEITHELESLKHEFPGDSFLKQKEPHEPAHRFEEIAFSTEPQDAGAGPQTYEEVVLELLRRRYDRLVRHARRVIRHDEAAGDIPPGALDACDVVDEAARQAEARDHAGQKPGEMTWNVWLYHLIHEELRRQRRVLREKQLTEVSAEQPATPAEFGDSFLEPTGEPAANEMEFNAGAAPSRETVTEREMLELLDQDMTNWPRPERETFELCYVEEIDPREVATITRQPLNVVHGHIAFIQQRSRQAMRARKKAAV
jgi:ribosomal subunit interface protein